MEMTSQLSTKVTPKFHELVSRCAFKIGISISDVVRIAVREYLEKEFGTEADIAFGEDDNGNFNNRGRQE